MNPVRFVGVLALCGAAAIPVATVHTAAAPRIDYIRIDAGRATRVSGRGVPGTPLALTAVQRHFIEGAFGDPIDLFEWCASPTAGQPAALGATTVGPDGTWAVEGLALAVLPAVATTTGCAGGLQTRLLVDSPYGPPSTPVVSWMNLKQLTPAEVRLAGAIEFADVAAIAVADGPTGYTYLPPDFVTDGIDLCASPFGCGARVSWRCDGGSFDCLRLPVAEASYHPADHEFPFILGLLVGHRPGGSVLMATKGPRTTTSVTAAPNVLIHEVNSCSSHYIGLWG